MMPLPPVTGFATEVDELPPSLSAERLWPGLSAHRAPGAVPQLDMDALQRFKALMADELCPVQLARMCYDRLYAYERIALAHASASAALRQLALQLFHAYHTLDQASHGPRFNA